MQKIYTERAHLMCPQMNFGIIIEVKDEYNEKNRALQVIRYSDEKELSEECHYASVFAEFEKLIF